LGALRDGAAVAALQTIFAATREERLRRGVARALGRARGVAGAAALGEWLLAEGDRAAADGSRLTAGELFAARGALDVPGVPAALRGRAARPSWNQRLRAAVVRGWGASGEAAACDDVHAILVNHADEHDAVVQAACAAGAELGREHAQARPRLGAAIARLLDDPGMGVRFSAAGALARLGDAERRGALAARLAREGFGHLKRALREALVDLDRQADVAAAQAVLGRRVDELERAKLVLEQRLEALEKRLSETAKPAEPKPTA
jgi:hypothetical protein